MTGINMKRIIIFTLSIALAALYWNVSAQVVRVKAHLDSTVISLGDQINCKLQINTPKGYLVFWPQLNDTVISGVEIIKRSKLDTISTEDGKRLEYNQLLTITSFDSGYYALPPFVFTYKIPGDTTLYSIETEAILLSVHTIAVDTTQPIKPIKGPISAPYTLKEALPYIIAGVLLAGLIFLFFYIRKRRKLAKPIIPIPVAPAIPDFEIALRELERLRQEKLWQRGLLKDYHTKLTDIVRQYIFDHFGIAAQEMTSDEIIEKLNRLSISRLAMNKLRDILLLADLVKFAKEQPLPAEHDISMNNAIEFVKTTILNPGQSSDKVAKEEVNSPVSEFMTEKSKPNI